LFGTLLTFYLEKNVTKAIKRTIMRQNQNENPLYSISHLANFSPKAAVHVNQAMNAKWINTKKYNFLRYFKRPWESPSG